MWSSTNIYTIGLYCFCNFQVNRVLLTVPILVAIIISVASNDSQSHVNITWSREVSRNTDDLVDVNFQMYLNGNLSQLESCPLAISKLKHAYPVIAKLAFKYLKCNCYINFHEGQTRSQVEKLSRP